LTEDVV